MRKSYSLKHKSFVLMVSKTDDTKRCRVSIWFGGPLTHPLVKQGPPCICFAANLMCSHERGPDLSSKVSVGEKHQLSLDSGF